MNKKTQLLSLIALISLLAVVVLVVQLQRPCINVSQLTQTELGVWANEAIITTFNYDYKNYLQRQKDNMAKYFSSQAWIDYNKALNDSKLLDTVKTNSYTVSAVATQPPEIIQKDSTHWQANMPILVVYKNSQLQQQQNLQVSIIFSPAPSGQGVRGLMINSFKTIEAEPVCQCK